jgi:hypothetical protein
MCSVAVARVACRYVACRYVCQPVCAATRSLCAVCASRLDVSALQQRQRKLVAGLRCKSARSLNLAHGVPSITGAIMAMSYNRRSPRNSRAASQYSFCRAALCLRTPAAKGSLLCDRFNDELCWQRRGFIVGRASHFSHAFSFHCMQVSKRNLQLSRRRQRHKSDTSVPSTLVQAETIKSAHRIHSVLQ